MSQIVIYFLNSTSVLSFYIDVVLTLSIYDKNPDSLKKYLYLNGAQYPRVDQCGESTAYAKAILDLPADTLLVVVVVIVVGIYQNNIFFFEIDSTLYN